MKRCPECGREYDNSMMFCLDDGAELLYGPASIDEPATAILSEPQGLAGSLESSDASTNPKVETRDATDILPLETGDATFESLVFNKKIVISTALLAILTLGGFFGYRYLSSSSNTSKQIESIAVLPFENQSSDPNTDYLSDGVTESIINSLTQLPNLKVTARSSVFRYKGKETDPFMVGKQLGVRAILVGRVIQRGDSIFISTELLDVRDNTQLWGGQYSKKVADLLLVQRDIAKEITGNLRLQLSASDQNRLVKNYTENPEAYELYLKGRFFWNARTEDGIRKGIDYFQQAIAKDPTYALAYVGLADSYSALTFPTGALAPREAMPLAKDAAMKALAIDNTLAEAHASLASIKFYYDWDWPGAETEFQRAIELNPDNADAHHSYSHYLMAMGRTDESLTQSLRCLDLEPVNILFNVHLGWHYLYARQYDQAVIALQKSLELGPNFAQAHHWLGLTYEQQGRSSEAISELQEAITLLRGSSLVEAELAHVLAASGKKDAAEKELARLMETAQRAYVPAYHIAAIFARLGEKDQAFAWLDKAYDERSDLLVNLKREQKFDHLRDDPRYKEMLKRMNLSE